MSQNMSSAAVLIGALRVSRRTQLGNRTVQLPFFHFFFFVLYNINGHRNMILRYILFHLKSQNCWENSSDNVRFVLDFTLVCSNSSSIQHW